MSKLVYVKNNYNLVSCCFLRKSKIDSRLFNWYLPSHLVDYVFINDDLKIKINGRTKRVRVINLTYDPLAQNRYKVFPLVKNQPGWQIRLIGRILDGKGIKYERERCFKGLKNIDGRPLRVDISFKIDEQWHLIEYHGVHHYFKMTAATRRFNNVRRIMETKRNWCVENDTPYLEIPFYKQNEINELLENFLNKKN